MSILVVGSVAFDTVETPFGRAEKVLGGSASFFAVAASFFVPVNLVGVVGDDFGEKELAAFAGRPIDLEGLERGDGQDLPLAGQVLVRPQLARHDLHRPERVRVLQAPDPRDATGAASHVFLGNIDPVLQRDVLDQVERPRARGLRHHELLDLGQAGGAAQDAGRASTSCSSTTRRRASSPGEWNLVKAARAIRAMGPRIAGGEEGRARRPDVHRARARSPPPPIRWRRSSIPPGAGDTFAGGFLGYLAGARGAATRRRCAAR